MLLFSKFHIYLQKGIIFVEYFQTITDMNLENIVRISFLNNNNNTFFWVFVNCKIVLKAKQYFKNYWRI